MNSVYHLEYRIARKETEAAAEKAPRKEAEAAAQTAAEKTPVIEKKPKAAKKEAPEKKPEAAAKKAPQKSEPVIRLPLFWLHTALGSSGITCLRLLDLKSFSSYLISRQVHFYMH